MNYTPIWNAWVLENVPILNEWNSISNWLSENSNPIKTYKRISQEFPLIEQEKHKFAYQDVSIFTTLARNR